MYGMVNQAIEAMVMEKLGADAWIAIKAKAEVHEQIFVTMKQYPDQITYALAGAVADYTKQPIEEVLRNFGIYWIQFALNGPWGKLLHSSGRSTYELLATLDAMHARIAVSFPDLQPPSFRVLPQDGGMLLEYRSHRPGLAPFVVGLVEGIGLMFHESVQVKQVASKASGAPCDTFTVVAMAQEQGALETC